MSSIGSMSYFDTKKFLDGTGRGKSIQKVQFNLESDNDKPSMPSFKTNNTPKKTRRLPSVVCVDIPLPLPSTLDHQTPIYLPCAQFPRHFISSTSLSILHWSKYHGRNISFYLKDIGYFSTADRSDSTRCREDFRYLKRLIYNIDDSRHIRNMKVNFDLNIGSAYLNPAEPSTSIDSLLWWISQHKATLLDHQQR
jgi:hypothetical protein